MGLLREMIWSPLLSFRRYWCAQPQRTARLTRSVQTNLCLISGMHISTNKPTHLRRECQDPLAVAAGDQQSSSPDSMGRSGPASVVRDRSISLLSRGSLLRTRSFPIPPCTPASGPYLSPGNVFGPPATIWRNRGSTSRPAANVQLSWSRGKGRRVEAAFRSSAPIG